MGRLLAKRWGIASKFRDLQHINSTAKDIPIRASEHYLSLKKVKPIMIKNERKIWIMEENLKCPVCGKFEFEGYDDMDMCDVCGWSNDALQVEKPDYTGGANMMSLNQAKEAYRQGKHIE